MTRSRAFALVLALSLGRPAAGASPPVAHPWDTAVADVGRVEQGVVDATNDYRHGEGRSALSAEEVLDRAAQRFADWMARNDKYGHEADGRTASQRLREQGYRFCKIGENIAYAYDSRGFETATLTKQFFVGWKNSAPHRRNLLDRGVTVTGVGVARSPKTGYYYAVQLFAHPGCR